MLTLGRTYTSRSSWLAILALCLAAPSFARGEAPAAAAPDGLHAIILGSAPGQAEAEALVQSQWPAGAHRRMLHEVIRLAPHHPKVVKGDQLQGLDPASYFVVLGICRRDQLDVPYQILKELYPRVSERPVVAAQADDCPRPTEGARPLGARSLSSAGRRLTVATYVKDPGTQGTSRDPNPGTLAVIAALFDEKGRYMDSQVLGCVNSSDYPGEPRCRFELKPAQDRIVVTRDYECTTGQGCIDEYLRLVEEVTFRIGKGNKVEMRTRILASELTEAE